MKPPRRPSPAERSRGQPSPGTRTAGGRRSVGLPSRVPVCVRRRRYTSDTARTRIAAGRTVLAQRAKSRPAPGPSWPLHTHRHRPHTPHRWLRLKMHGCQDGNRPGAAWSGGWASPSRGRWRAGQREELHRGRPVPVPGSTDVPSACQSPAGHRAVGDVLPSRLILGPGSCLLAARSGFSPMPTCAAVATVAGGGHAIWIRVNP